MMRIAFLCLALVLVGLAVVVPRLHRSTPNLDLKDTTYVVTIDAPAITPSSGAAIAQPTESLEESCDETCYTARTEP